MDFETWRPKLKVPEEIRQYVKGLRVSDYERNCEGGIWVNFQERNGIDYQVLAIDAYACWHTDGHIDHPHTCLCVLRNEVNSWVEVKGCEVVRDQPVGSMVSLNIHRRHRLNAPKGRYAPTGLWVGLAVDSLMYRTQAAWTELFREIFA